jgi:hypothetical protein
MDNGTEFISQALQQFCDGSVGMSYIPPGTPWNNGHTTAAVSALAGSVVCAHHRPHHRYEIESGIGQHVLVAGALPPVPGKAGGAADSRREGSLRRRPW